MPKLFQRGPVLPEIIQGGMGVHVSNHRLARTVAMAGGLGVVSGTGLDGVYARLLQDGDRGARWAIERFPNQEIAERLLAKYFKPEGRQGKPYKNLHKWIIDPRNDRQRASLAEIQELAVASAFAEVTRAKHRHDGVVGINVLRKIALPIPATIYGAMLAGVDVVLTGAGSPDEMPRLLDDLARHHEGALSVKVLRSAPGAEHATRFDPGQLPGMPEAPLPRPRFLAIVASVDLATGLAAQPATRPDGFVVEGATAGGHNAPPRGPWRPQTNPSYGDRDDVDLAAIAAIGLPFWLAGSYGTPEGLRSARSAGARGIQAGTVFALSRESGLTPELRQQVLGKVADGTLEVITDGSVSPTGFPFKVHQLEGTLSDPAVRDARARRCDLSYLRQPMAGEDGELVYICPAEPEPTLKSKGGREQQAAGRVCLCNALFAAAGLAQERHDGYVEAPIFTGGADIEAVRRLSPDGGGYSATAALSFIRDETPASTGYTGAAASA